MEGSAWSLSEELKTSNVRRELDLRVGRPVPPEMYRRLAETLPAHSVETWLTDAAAQAQRELEYHSRRRARGRVDVLSPSRPEGLRWDALRLIFAHEAASDPHLLAWRRTRLEDGLLLREQVSDYLGRASESDFNNPPKIAGLVMRPDRFTWRFPDGESGAVMDMTGRGRLAELRALAESLAADYPWSVEESVAFVLTGQPPNVWRISAEIEAGDTASATRIILSIDPRATPDSVIAAYRAAREHSILDGLSLGERTRPVSEKGAALAVHRSLHEHRTWPEQREAWNADRPEWSYSDDRAFRRDVLRAWEAVVGRQRQKAGD